MGLFPFCGDKMGRTAMEDASGTPFVLFSPARHQNPEALPGFLPAPLDLILLILLILSKGFLRLLF
jgi:hypothetical protein